MPEQAGPHNIHATCIAFGKDGVLLLGPPGSGKSDLALRLIDHPGALLPAATLVSDDQTLIEQRGSALFASPPSAIAGKLEIRGLGIITLPFRRDVRLVLAVEHRAAAAIERMPPICETYFASGFALPLVAIDFLAASAPARLCAAVMQRGHIAS